MRTLGTTLARAVATALLLVAVSAAPALAGSPHRGPSHSPRVLTPVDPGYPQVFDLATPVDTGYPQVFELATPVDPGYPQ
jgi:hypothetical protein